MTISTKVDAPPARLGRVGTIVDERAGALQKAALAGRPAAVAALARLRRGVGKQPGELLDILEFTLADEFYGRTDADATADEKALHVAMTLFALHQQSRSEPMHRRGSGLGASLRALHSGNPNDIPDPIRRRFRVLGTADSFTELSYHLRGAVQLLRGAAIPLDYGRLADQLGRWQRPGGAGQVGLSWGREFYRTQRETAEPAAAAES